MLKTQPNLLVVGEAPLLYFSRYLQIDHCEDCYILGTSPKSGP